MFILCSFYALSFLILCLFYALLCFFMIFYAYSVLFRLSFYFHYMLVLCLFYDLFSYYVRSMLFLCLFYAHSILSFFPISMLVIHPAFFIWTPRECGTQWQWTSISPKTSVRWKKQRPVNITERRVVYINRHKKIYRILIMWWGLLIDWRATFQ